MTLTTGAGVVLIVSAIWFNVWFAVLARSFDYPDILRRPPAEILRRFREGGSTLILSWWAFMLSGALFITAVVLLFRVLGAGSPTWSLLALVAGVLAGLVQVLGLLRWVYLVPMLARTHESDDADNETRAAVAVTFRAFHQYLGVGVGEHLGYLLTGIWTALIGAVVVSSSGVANWIGWIAIPIGVGLVAASAEFLGPNEERGWKLAGAAVPVIYIGWSVWLIALGIALIA